MSSRGLTRLVLIWLWLLTRRRRRGGRAPAPSIGRASDGLFLQLAAFPLRQTAPDPEALVVLQCVLEALAPNVTTEAHLLRLAGGSALLREESLRVGLGTQRPFLPVRLLLDRLTVDNRHQAFCHGTTSSTLFVPLYMWSLRSTCLTSSVLRSATVPDTECPTNDTVEITFRQSTKVKLWSAIGGIRNTAAKQREACVHRPPGSVRYPVKSIENIFRRRFGKGLLRWLVRSGRLRPPTLLPLTLLVVLLGLGNPWIHTGFVGRLGGRRLLLLRRFGQRLRRRTVVGRRRPGLLALPRLRSLWLRLLTLRPRLWGFRLRLLLLPRLRKHRIWQHRLRLHGPFLLGVLLACPLLLTGVGTAPLLLLRPLLALVLTGPLLLGFCAPRLRWLGGLGLAGPRLLGRLLLRFGLAGGPVVLLALVPGLLLRPLLALRRRVTTGRTRSCCTVSTAVLTLALVVLSVTGLRLLLAVAALLLPVRRLLSVLTAVLTLRRELTGLRCADRGRQGLVGLEDVETGGAVQGEAADGVDEADDLQAGGARLGEAREGGDQAEQRDHTGE